MKSAVTVSLVPEARGGPFVFWDDLAAGVRQAAHREQQELRQVQDERGGTAPLSTLSA